MRGSDNPTPKHALMATPISKLDHFKLETTFGDGYVVNKTYHWDYSKRKTTGSSKWIREREIGVGAFGSVWLEKEEGGGQLRAVKRLQRSSLMASGFSQELLALITLTDHNHLFVEFLGWYENAVDIFFAMEFIEHGDLSEYMKDRPTTRVNAGEITKQVLEGLDVLHKEGICHRDLKPQNVLVASRDPLWVKIADFGTSKRATHTALRTMCGTQGYLAPEILGILPRRYKTRQEFTHAIDMWSLGCLVHELLTAQTPFLDLGSGHDELSDMTESDFAAYQSETDMESLYTYCQGEADFPTHVLQSLNVPEEGIKLIKSLLLVDPGDRATASSALQSPWLANSGYANDWYNKLQTEFSGLGLDLEFGQRYDKTLIRRIHTFDITRLLPISATTDLTGLLEQALLKGHNMVALMLMKSPSRDPAGIRELFKRAVEDGRIGLIKMLLLCDVIDVNLASFSNGRTALHVAVDQGLADIVQLLLENNGDVNTWSAYPNSRTPLQSSAALGDIEIVKLLLHCKADVNAPPARENGQTALQAAAGNGHVDIVHLLMDRGADINAIPAVEYGRTALQAAAESGHINLVKLLLDHGAAVNAGPAAEHGRTALQAAAGSGYIDGVKLLLDHGAAINADPAAKHGRTALQAAAGSGYIDAVKLLLDHRAAVHARPAAEHGRTALQAAAGGGHIDVVYLLLDREADINAAPAARHGQTALQAAAGGGHTNIVKLLLDHMSPPTDQDVNIAFSTATDYETVEALKDYKSRITLNLVLQYICQTPLIFFWISLAVAITIVFLAIMVISYLIFIVSKSHVSTFITLTLGICIILFLWYLF